MASVSPSSLLNKMNATCKRGLEAAAGLCLSRTNYNVEIEHWLLKLLEAPNTDLTRILKHYDVDPARANRELTKALDGLRTGNARAPELSLDILDLMREAWVLTSLEYAGYRVRSGYLLEAERHRNRMCVINADQPPETVSQAIWHEIEKFDLQLAKGAEP